MSTRWLAALLLSCACGFGSDPAEGAPPRQRVGDPIAAPAPEGAVASASAGPDDPGAVAQMRQRVIDGSAAPEDLPAVALIARRLGCGEEEPLLLCSGALIAPDVVLTAAHCLEAFGTDGHYEVFFGERLFPGSPGRFVQVASAAVHPGYERSTHEWDVAALRLAIAVDVEPFALPARPIGEDFLEPGQPARVVGFGETQDPSVPAGERRQGLTRITDVSATTFRAVPDPAMSCVGDSGGPVLVRSLTGEEEILVGLTIRGDVGCRSEAVAWRIDNLLDDFVREAMNPPADPQTGAAPAWNALCSAPCETSADCPAGLACESGGSGERRCLLHGLLEGNYGAVCIDDEGCGHQGRCARLASEGPDACRCFEPCEAIPSPGAGGCSEEDGCVRPKTGGCSASGGEGGAGTVFMGASLAFLLNHRLRRSAQGHGSRRTLRQVQRMSAGPAHAASPPPAPSRLGTRSFRANSSGT